MSPPALTEAVPQTTEVPATWERPSWNSQLTRVTHSTHFVCAPSHLLPVDVLESFELGVISTSRFHPGPSGNPLLQCGASHLSAGSAPRRVRCDLAPAREGARTRHAGAPALT